MRLINCDRFVQVQQHPAHTGPGTQLNRVHSFWRRREANLLDLHWLIGVAL